MNTAASSTVHATNGLTELEYEISWDTDRIDRAYVHRFLATESYWASDIPFEVVDRSIDHSLNFGVYISDRGTQVGFGRVITDQATFAFIRDVFIDQEHRGNGLGAILVSAMLDHPSLQGLRRIMLATKDAHGLYERFGFAPLRRPDRFLSQEHSAKELYGQ